ncbi:sugar phosphate isomerase/epimerase family protein [Alicyclobacillus shizuokensis]|uniref:sugar phosphate isomerase/epimerase family protein n=1 Tax=Alicyclobacillus shizuokensis TaxID=392014 RepID=UPI000832A373|nr:sugar phosphate isomerase/epimerase family protein [Alicyclobacillus shizuokensis]MCL6625230.1 sugar phosphate isomerase/epimerase [Alicyclobacillus shizuokensis]
MKVAYSNLACPEWSVDEVFENAVRYGYQGVELRLLHGDVIPAALDPAQTKLIAAAARTRGIEIVGIGASTRFAMEDEEERMQNVAELLRYLELADRIGAPMVRTFGGTAPASADASSTREVNQRVAESLRQVSRRAQELGVYVLLETHDDFSPSFRVAEVLRAVDSPYVKALWDTHHPYRMGETVETTLNNLREWLHHVHLKDARRKGDDWEFVLFGEGEVPVQEIVHQVLNDGYDGWFCVEWERKWHPEIADAHVALPKHREVLEGYFQAYEKMRTR